jgi:hypothetical protein
VDQHDVRPGALLLIEMAPTVDGQKWHGLLQVRIIKVLS